MKNVIIAVIGILIAISIFVIVFPSQKTQKPISPVSNSQPDKPAIIENFTTYNDPSGFAFQYPQGIVVSPKKLQNNQFYSSLEIASTGSAQVITITAEDSSLNTIDDWFKGDKKTSVFGTINKMKLADLDARQFEANNAQTTIALDQGVLFTVATNAKKGSDLEKTYQKIVNSFAFVQPTQSVQNSSSGQSGGSSDIIDEGEEVVQ